MISTGLPCFFRSAAKLSTLAGEIPFDEASEERIMALAALEHAEPGDPGAKPPMTYGEAEARS